MARITTTEIIIGHEEATRLRAEVAAKLIVERLEFAWANVTGLRMPNAQKLVELFAGIIVAAMALPVRAPNV